MLWPLTPPIVHTHKWPWALVHTSWGLRNTLHSLAPLIVHLGEIGEPLVHCIVILASCGTTGWLGWWISCYAWWLPSPSRPSDWRDRWAALMIVANSDQSYCMGLLCSSLREIRKSNSSEIVHIVGVHLFSGSCGTQVMGLVCVAN
jgi:hypothetical protein